MEKILSIADGKICFHSENDGVVKLNASMVAHSGHSEKSSPLKRK